MRRKVAAKKSSFGADLIEGMKLVLAHQRGTVNLEQVWPKPIDVRAIRKRVKMLQAEFSRAYRISKRALQEWEQGGRQPDSAAPKKAR
jgi:DNA-binding transcriptional regulator YiaG